MNEKPNGKGQRWMFKIKERQSLMVSIASRRVIRVLRHYGRIQYVSKKMRYVVMYVDAERVASVLPEIQKLRNVTKVEFSHWRELDPEVVDLKSTGLYKTQDEDD